MAFAFTLLVFSSGSFYAAACKERRFEEALPLTLCLITLILYTFGWFNQLLLGVYAVLGITLFLCAYSLYGMLKKGNIKKFLFNFFTPAFFIFLTLALIAFFCNYGRLAYSWDEFSHWADVVKAMQAVNGLSTHPDAHSVFASYPPAMSLLQFMGVAIFELIPPPAVFSQSGNSEWPLYFIYLTASFALFMPFLKSLSFRKPLSVIISGVLVFLLPGLLNPSFYTSIYIDSYLGVFSGFCLAYIFSKNLEDILEQLTLFLSLFTLVLVKDAAMLFAVACVIALTLKILTQPIHFSQKARSSLPLIVLCIISILLAKGSWLLSIHLNHVSRNFSAPYNILDTLNAFLGTSNSYKVDVIKNFSQHLINGISLAPLYIPISYYFIFIVLFIICVWGSSQQKHNRYIPFICLLIIATYTIGLLITYMNKFSEYEAINLASIDRYLSILLTALLFVAFVLVISNTHIHQKAILLRVLCILCVLFIAPYSDIRSLLTRRIVDTSFNYRKVYEQVSSRTLNILENQQTSDSPKVFVISQATTGFDWMVLRYSLRPYQISSIWSLGYPFFENDTYSVSKTPEDLKTELEDYSHILLWNINPYFADMYGSLFDDPIYPNSLYKKNENGTFTNVFHPTVTEIAAFSLEQSSNSEFLRYVDLADIIDFHGMGSYTFEIEMKTEVPSSTTVYMQNGSTAKYSFSKNMFTTSDYETYSFSCTIVPGNANDVESWLSFYSGYGTGAFPSVRSVRVFKNEFASSDL